MREHVSTSGQLDREYKDIKRAAMTASPRDVQFLEFLENDIGRYESFENLEWATTLILDRVSSTYSQDAALRLRDLHARRVALEMTRHAETLPQLYAIRDQIREFPFEYEDIMEGTHAAFDKELELSCKSLIDFVADDKDKLRRLRSTIAEFPFLSPERHAKVFQLLAKAEGAKSVHLH